MSHLKKFTITIFFFIISQNLYAEDVTVEMLNKSGDEVMVYSKKIVRINAGEKVLWKSTDPGHNVEFIRGGVPDGVSDFRSNMSKDVDYKFDKPGIYAYQCTPHKVMGMIGFVVVNGDKSNLEDIKKIKYMGLSKKLAVELISQL
tara:strand:- start:2973 stop:3407 length:435 start_codon:yes stop_codon:yes gene_type:complete